MVDMGVVRVDSEEGGEAGDGKRKWMDLGLVFCVSGLVTGRRSIQPRGDSKQPHAM